jgi:hypothetical protein
MTMVFRRSLGLAAVPFPDAGEGHFLHDWWIAGLAASLGGLAGCSDALVRHRAHGRNVIGPLRNAAAEPGWVRRSRARQLAARTVLSRCLMARLARQGRAAPPQLIAHADPGPRLALSLARVFWRALRARDRGMARASRRLAEAVALELLAGRAS